MSFKHFYKLLALSLSFFLLCSCNQGGGNGETPVDPGKQDPVDPDPIDPVEEEKNLEIDSLPLITKYEVDQTLSFEGLKVVDKVKGTEISDYVTSVEEGYVFLESDIGDFKIDVSKEGYESTSFIVKVSASTVIRTLHINSTPNKTSYKVGEAFSSEGLVVYDEYLNQVTTDYNLSYEEGYVFKDEDIGSKVIYVTKRKYYGASFMVYISEAEPDTPSGEEEVLKKQKEAAITEITNFYNDFNLSLYDDDGVNELLGYKNDCISNINKATSKEEIDAALLDAKTKMNNVEQATPATLTGIEITQNPTKTSYNTGDELDLTGLVVKANYSDDSSVVITGYTVDDVDMSSPSESLPVYVRYEGFNDVFYIKIVTKSSGKQTIEIYATNDFHGQIEEQSGRSSLTQLMSYMKDKSDDQSTLLLDQGDTWQGSIYSNYNRGKLITDVMNYVQYDARTVGNHDFDWGVDAIKQNTAIEYNGYRTPVLAANVYDYNFSTKQIGTTQQSDIGTTTVTYVLENGVKVGIVGTIGQDQITSITSLYTMEIGFKNHIDIIKEEATKLRNEGCDIVISSCHAGQEELLNNYLADYIDLALCAHTHQKESTTEDGVLFAQYGAYGQYIGHITLTYDMDTKQVSYNEESISSYTVSSTSIDSTINKLVNDYNKDCDAEAKEVVASNVSGYFSKTEEMPNLMCKAMYEQAVSEGYEIDLAYVNQARQYFNLSSWTYANLYQAFPFDNVVYIVDISYNEMKKQISSYNSYNNVYRSPSFDGTLTPGQTYRIATIDYLFFHTNSNRYYDYFSDTKGQYVGYLDDNYRIILRNFLRNNGYKTGTLLKADDFSSSLTSFSREFIY